MQASGQIFGFGVGASSTVSVANTIFHMYWKLNNVTIITRPDGGGMAWYGMVRTTCWNAFSVIFIVIIISGAFGYVSISLQLCTTAHSLLRSLRDIIYCLCVHVEHVKLENDDGMGGSNIAMYETI